MPELARQDSGLMSFGGGGQKMSTSLDLQNPSNRVILLKAFQDCDMRLTEAVNVLISAVDYVAHEISLVSKETGELVDAVRLVVIDTDGATYECVSTTLLKSLQTVAFAYGPPPWSPPMTLTVRTKKRGERSIYWFDAEQQKSA